jgi:hypothetical protein
VLPGKITQAGWVPVCDQGVTSANLVRDRTEAGFFSMLAVVMTCVMANWPALLMRSDLHMNLARCDERVGLKACVVDLHCCKGSELHSCIWSSIFFFFFLLYKVAMESCEARYFTAKFT